MTEDRFRFEAAVWATVAVLAWAASAYFNVAHTISSFMRQHEEWRLEDFFTVVVFLGIAAFITGFFQSRHHRKVRRAAERKAFEAARRDVLTGLPNRQMFLELAGLALGEAWDSGRKCAALFVDLDGFKPVNDTLGHAAGDALLIAVGNRLQQCAPKGALAARLGGDEFAILLTNTGRGAADPMLAAKVILTGIQHPFDIEGREVTINASIGIACGPENGRRAEDLLNAADVAMYKAKRAGRGTIRVFSAAEPVETECLPDGVGPAMNGVLATG
jgi:diguanylate cyclase (GGDEF)-like protein